MFEDSFARLRVELRFLFLLSACVRHCRLVLSHHLKHISIDLLQIQFLLRKFLKILASLLLNTRLVLLPLFVLLFVELGRTLLLWLRLLLFSKWKLASLDFLNFFLNLIQAFLSLFNVLQLPQRLLSLSVKSHADLRSLLLRCHLYELADVFCQCLHLSQKPILVLDLELGFEPLLVIISLLLLIVLLGFLYVVHGHLLILVHLLHGRVQVESKLRRVSQTDLSCQLSGKPRRCLD